MTAPLAPQVGTLLAAGTAVILVTVTRAAGSTPRASGACMAVTPAATFGTIGGGRLEWEAVQRARAMIADGTASAGLDLPLGPAVGQCCGGHVVLGLRRAAADDLAALRAAEALERRQWPEVLVCGAGHVGRALVRALQALPLRLRWADERAEQFPSDIDPKVEIDPTDGRDAIGRAASGAAVFVMTHSHRLDFALTAAALARADFAYVGLIGSRTKRRRFERWFAARGGDARGLGRLTSPIGDAGVADKRPEVIAALAAAELLQALAQHRAQQAPQAVAR